MPSNLRIISNNVADIATLTASSRAGSLFATNLQNDLKSQIWRSVGTTPTLTLVWASAQIVSGFALVFSNMTEASTIRARGYAEEADTTPLFDTGNIQAVPPSLGGFEWGLNPAGVNSYSYGGGSTAVLWWQPTAIKKLIININNSASPTGYVEASRVVVGDYFSPVYNAPHGGLKVGVEDTSKHDRSSAGDLLTDRGVMYKTLDIDLQLMPQEDRNKVWAILRGNGMSRPVFICVFPENQDDPQAGQIYTIYGKLSRGSSLTYSAYNQYATTLQVEEV